LIENLSHEEYMMAMRDCDIYIDQVHSADAHGVAALENLASGKIVVSGNGGLNWGSFSFMKKAPIVRASPNPLTLADRLSDLLDQKREFEGLASEGRQYVVENHNPVLVASLFLNLCQEKSTRPT
jgi:glycosyltransferase involved in cell wall biosynthesis